MKFCKAARVMTSAIVGSMISVGALAYDAGDFIARGGIARAIPNDSSGLLRANNAPVAGTGVGVGSDTELGLTGSYMITKDIGVELLASSPFKHDIIAKGGTLAGLGLSGKIGEVKHLPPTISLQYYFNNPSIATPYVGAGYNYTWILDESLTSHAQSVLGSNDFKLSNSQGLALEAGVDVKLTDHLLFNAAVWHVNLDTTGHIRNTVLGDVKVDVHVDPWVYMIGIGYKF